MSDDTKRQRLLVSQSAYQSCGAWSDLGRGFLRLSGSCSDRCFRASPGRRHRSRLLVSPSKGRSWSFLALIFFYAWRMNRLDREHGVDEQ